MKHNVKELETKLHNAISVYMKENNLQGTLDTTGGSVKMALFGNSDWKHHEKSISIITNEITVKFMKDNGASCECGNCEGSYNLREGIAKAIDKAIKDVPLSINDEGEIDHTEQVDTASHYVMSLLTKLNIFR